MQRYFVCAVFVSGVLLLLHLQVFSYLGLRESGVFAQISKALVNVHGNNSPFLLIIAYNKIIVPTLQPICCIMMCRALNAIKIINTEKKHGKKH